MAEIKIGMLFEIPEKEAIDQGQYRVYGYFKVNEKVSKDSDYYWCRSVHMQGFDVKLFTKQILSYRVVA